MTENLNQTSHLSSIKAIGFLVGGVLLGGMISAGYFISKYNNKSQDISEAIGEPVLNVDGKVWTTSQLPSGTAAEYYNLESKIDAARRMFFRHIGARIALSTDAGKTVTDKTLPKLDELLSVSLVSEAETKQYYDKVIQEMGNGVFGGKSFESIKTQLQNQLSQQLMAENLEKKVHELENSGRIKVLLKAPVSPPFQIDTDGFPMRGNKNSNNTLIEIVDYLCTHCRDAERILSGVLKEKKENFKVFSLVYASSSKSLSGSLARGAYCAFEQGQAQFEAYHENAFKVPFEKMRPSGKGDPSKEFDNVAIEVASKSQLKIDSFTACLSSEKAEQFVMNVKNKVTDAPGFVGTPTFYLNGKQLQFFPQKFESTLSMALN